MLAQTSSTGPSDTRTFIIADDHPLFRGAMKHALQQNGTSADAINIIEADDFESACRALASHPDTDLVLLDLTMPGVSGFSGLVSFRAQYADVPVVIVSASDDPSTVRRALELGASGFVSKSSSIDTIRSAVATVLAGDISIPADFDLGLENDPEIADIIKRLTTLTPQQTRVLTMIGEGLLNKQIAYELSVSEATVKAHVSAVLQKLNVDSRTQAVIKMNRIGAEAIEPAHS
jgi:DNA-binding NarL/FixJ family response regulator